MTPCPAPARTAQPCLPAEVGVLPVGPGGGAGVQRGLFSLLLCRDSTEEWSNTSLALLTSMDSVGSLASLSHISSISTGSLYSFPDSWHGAMMELPALNCSAPSQSRKAVCVLLGQPEPDRGQERPLQPVSWAEQDQDPGDKEDRVQSPKHVKPSPTSSPHMPMTVVQLIPEFIRAIQANELSTEQRRELLQKLQAQEQGEEGGSRGACGGTPPGELPRPPTKTEEDVPLAVWPQSLGEHVSWLDDHVDEAVDGVLHWDRAMSPETLSSMYVEVSSSMDMERSSSMVSEISNSTGQSVRSRIVSKRSSPMAPQRTSPKGLQRSSPTGPERSSSELADIITSMGGPASSIPAASKSSTQAETGPQQLEPTGRAHGRAAWSPCRAGRCLREGWRRLKAWWRCHFQPLCDRCCKSQWWQRWFHKDKGIPYH